MATGYIRIKKEKLHFKFHLNKPIEEREVGNYAIIINGNLYLSLGAHYIMFCFEKELENHQCIKYQSVDTKYYTDIWNEIVSMDRLDVSYNPSYDRLGNGIIDFTIYLNLDEWNYYELKMAMDLLYNPIDI
jgi:hypothetical protein